MVSSLIRNLVLVAILLAPGCPAWTLGPQSRSEIRPGRSQMDATKRTENNRRVLLDQMVASACGIAIWKGGTLPANALVKGNAPPPKSKPSGDKPKCTNVEECQAQAELRAAEERKLAEASSVPPSVTAGGTRYIDLDLGKPNERRVKEGDDVKLYYKVLKLGKRSYDGLSGEGTVVFSRGYGLEDDESTPGVKSFDTFVGSPFNIAALNDALVGMALGGTRRFSILPQKGWEKATSACDGGPGGRGAGGDLKTDYVVVPTATMVEQEACFDTTKQPFPVSYAQQRRMAQRFDQALIMEVQVAGFNN